MRFAGQELINCTPHVVRVEVCENRYEIGGTYFLEIEPSGSVPRVNEVSSRDYSWTEDIDGNEHAIQMSLLMRTGEIEGLPPKQAGKFLIVSSIVAQAASERDDLLVPYPLIRDENQRIVGCAGFAKIKND